jgi:hypothetical protein
MPSRQLRPARGTLRQYTAHKGLHSDPHALQTRAHAAPVNVHSTTCRGACKGWWRGTDHNDIVAGLQQVNTAVRADEAGPARYQHTSPPAPGHLPVPARPPYHTSTRVNLSCTRSLRDLLLCLDTDIRMAHLSVLLQAALLASAVGEASAWCAVASSSMVQSWGRLCAAGGTRVLPRRRAASLALCTLRASSRGEVAALADQLMGLQLPMKVRSG